MKRYLLMSAACCILFSAAAEAQDGQYVVLFGFDQSALDATAEATVATAADEFRRTGSANLSVIGHTDTSGNASYNHALSERRVAAVTEKLIQLGVPADAINGAAVGEDQPAVQTGDGVAEEQNRRVDIAIAIPPPPPPPAPAPEPAPQVVEAAPPPPPPPSRWLVGAGLFYGYNFEDEQSTHSDLGGVNFSFDYRVANWLTTGLEQAGFYHWDTDNDGFGGRTVIGPDFTFGDPAGFQGFVGANFGVLYGAGINDDLIAGPEIGFRANIFDLKVGYDIPFNRDLDEGIIVTTLGGVFSF
jgi:OmpA family